jgi:hypothetical protein
VPSTSVTTVRWAVVARFLSVTLAPRTPNPWGSKTDPESVAVLTCALARTAEVKSSKDKAIHTHSFILRIQTSSTI